MTRDAQARLGAWVLTVSDRVSGGLREDRSGPRLVTRLRELGLDVGGCDVVADGRSTVGEALRGLCHRTEVQLILTTGGTGLAPRDLTPEATRDVAEREVPGLMELARRRCGESTPFAALSRGVAATRGRTLIVNLPGNPEAAQQTLDAMADVLLHAVTILATPTPDCEITGRDREADPTLD